MRLKADLTLLAVAIIWGSAFIAQGVAAQHGIAYLYNAASFLLATIILLPLIPRANKISRQQVFWTVLVGFILFMGSTLQQVGIYYTKVANAGFITSLYVIFIPFILLLGFREKPNKLDLLAVFIAALGAFLLSTAGHIQFQPGDTLELIGAVFWALHMVILGKFASRYEPLSFAAGQYLVSGVLSLLLGLFIEDKTILLVPAVIGAVLFRALFSIAIGYTLQVWGQRHTPPTDAALILGLESVFATIFGWLLLNQLLLPIQVLGCFIIFTAVMLSQIKNINPGNPASAPIEPL